jgi:chromate transporter
MEAKAPRVSLVAIYRCFFWIGLFSFGGGLLPWIQREVVDTRKWMTDEEFFPAVALSQVLPGVNSTNVSIYVGQHLRGAMGAATALGAMLTGPFFMVLLAAASYKIVLGVPAIQAATAGVAAAAIGMLLKTAMSAVQAASKSLPPILIMVATFVAIEFFKFSLVTTVLLMTPISVLVCWPREKKDA